MTYDPFQTSSVMGAYPGASNPFQVPYATGLGMNPAATMNPTMNPLALAFQGAGGFGVNPQQLQLAQILAARTAAAQLLGPSPWAHNPYATAALLQHPLLGAGLENPLLNPLLAHSQFGGQPHLFNPHIGQGVSQFGQFGSPYGQIPPLAPQSWVGQPGFGQTGFIGSQGISQYHPLAAQLGGRGFCGVDSIPGSASKSRERPPQRCRPISNEDVPEICLRHALTPKSGKLRPVRKQDRRQRTGCERKPR